MDLAKEAPSWAIVLLVGLLMIAAVQDVVQRKISNILCAALLFLVVGAAVTVAPSWSLWQNAAGMVGVLAIGTLMFGAGMVGGGDVKLLAVTMPWFAPHSVGGLLLAVATAGGLLALVMIVARRTVSRVRTARAGHGAGIPYGVAIAAGTIATLLI